MASLFDGHLLDLQSLAEMVAAQAAAGLNIAAYLDSQLVHFKSKLNTLKQVPRSDGTRFINTRYAADVFIFAKCLGEFIIIK